MNLAVQQAESFKQDFISQFAWYVEVNGPDVARRFQVALDQTLTKLALRPDLGRPRHFRNIRLKALRSCQVERPFNRILIFYRVSGGALQAIRLMHGARNLPQRLVEPPARSSD